MPKGDRKRPGRGVRPTFDRAAWESVESLWSERADCKGTYTIAVQEKPNGEERIVVIRRGASILLDGAIWAITNHGTGNTVRMTIMNDEAAEEEFDIDELGEEFEPDEDDEEDE